MFDQDRAGKIFLEVLRRKNEEMEARLREIEAKMKVLSKISEDEATEEHFRNLVEALIECRILRASMEALERIMVGFPQRDASGTYRI